jgi:hypothetical protein
MAIMILHIQLIYLSVETQWQGFKQSYILFPLSRGILLAQDLIVAITIHSSTLFLEITLNFYRNATFLVTNSLVTCL